MSLNSDSVSEMASRLVETVMINVDDFADSFLTCGTCFTGYDTRDRAAKLLPCSHTICRSCLDRILETQTQSDSFRCPICRETIAIPNGGAASFPPAFIVNQLLDLIATQRRDVVPKCRIHANQELLFCETCDVVFCAECRGRSHTSQLNCGTNNSTPVLTTATATTTTVLPFDDGRVPSLGDPGIPGVLSSSSGSSSGTALNHNVISFNVAIKRCTEIMLYKMHLCVQELNNAQDAVKTELDRLETNQNLCTEAVNSRFAEIIALVERRQAELLDEVKRLADDKYRALTDQLSLIESEREAVRRECNSLKGVLDVRTISKAISYLNGKLDTVTTLIEPRENAFLRYQDRGQSAPTTTATYQCGTDAKRVTHSSTLSGDLVVGTNIHVGVAASNQQDALGTDPYIGGTHGGAASAVGAGSTLVDISRCLAAFGRIVVSTTYPALCTARLPQQVVVNLHARAVIRAVDYHGRPQSTGGSDPVEVKLIDAEGRLVPTELLDVGDGSYQLILRPVTPGTHQLSIQILSRPIRGSPFQLPVRRAQQRRWCLNEGADGRGLIQPFAVTAGPYPIDEGSDQSTNQPARPVYVYLLDTGNSRLLVIDLITGKVQATLSGEPLASQAATGVAWSPHGLWIVNWRAKRVYLLDPRTDQVVHSIYSSQFVEPTSVFRCPTTGDLFVADNGAGCVFRCNPITGHTAPFVGAGAPPTSMVHSSQPADPTRTNSVPTSTPSPSLSQQQQTQQQSSADDSDASGSFGSSSIPLTSVASGSALEPRSWRQISGLCVTDTGELILSTGSTIRIFSRAGKQINCLVPPTGHTSSGSAHTLAVPMRPVSSLPTFDRTPPSGTDVAHTSGPTPSSPALNRASLHIATTTIIGIQDRMSLSGRSPTHRPTSSTPRGQFGGVCVTTSLTGDTECPDNLGRCLLASYSDRKRSGIAVWPQCYWAPSRYVSELDQEAIEEDAKATIFDNEPIKPFPRWANLNAAPSPYLVEVDPGFRRLAGLLALPNSRQLVVVDQGAQSLCRIRYA